jgi:hypothetical protein
MTAMVQKHLALQLSPFHLQCALFEAETLVRHEELPLYPSNASALERVSSWLKTGETPPRILAAATPPGRLLRLSSARGTPFAALTTLLDLPPGEKPVFTACNAQTGDPSEISGLFPRLLAAAPLASLHSSRAFFSDAGLPAARVFDAAYVQLGALASARETTSTPVLVWELGTDFSHFIILDHRGILAVEFCPVGIHHIEAAIQPALGLRFPVAASKLFFEGNYDFSDDGPKIVRRFLPDLRKCLTRLPVGPKYFHVAGLSRDQHWLTLALADAWCLQPLQIDWAAYGRVNGISFASRELAASLPASFGGLLLLAKHRDSDKPAWQARWSDEPKPKARPAAPAKPADKQSMPGLRPMFAALTNVFSKPQATSARRTPPAGAKPARHQA